MFSTAIISSICIWVNHSEKNLSVLWWSSLQWMHRGDVVRRISHYDLNLYSDCSVIYYNNIFEYAQTRDIANISPKCKFWEILRGLFCTHKIFLVDEEKETKFQQIWRELEYYLTWYSSEGIKWLHKYTLGHSKSSL